MTDVPQNSETGPALMEAGRLLFAGPCDFIMSVTAVPDLPDDGRPEVAFAGRSNVGKSSLINALTGRKTLARTSNTPGRTRQLNYFALGPALYLVDMPGYGYAKASKSLIKAWTALIHDYLRGRPSLRRVYLLIDARHGLKAGDREAMKLMDEAAVSYQIVLTKSDKPKQAELARLTAATAKELARHPAAHPEILATSSRSGAGVAELRAGIALFNTETH